MTTGRDPSGVGGHHRSRARPVVARPRGRTHPCRQTQRPPAQGKDAPAGSEDEVRRVSQVQGPPADRPRVVLFGMGTPAQHHPWLVPTRETTQPGDAAYQRARKPRGPRATATSGGGRGGRSCPALGRRSRSTPVKASARVTKEPATHAAWSRPDRVGPRPTRFVETPAITWPATPRWQTQPPRADAGSPPAPRHRDTRCRGIGNPGCRVRRPDRHLSPPPLASQYRGTLPVQRQHGLGHPKPGRHGTVCVDLGQTPEQHEPSPPIRTPLTSAVRTTANRKGDTPCSRQQASSVSSTRQSASTPARPLCSLWHRATVSCSRLAVRHDQPDSLLCGMISPHTDGDNHGEFR